MKFGPFLLAAVFVLLACGPERASACKYCEMALDPSLRVDFSTPDASPNPTSSTPANAPQTPSSATPPASAAQAATTQPLLSSVPATRATRLAALGLPTTSLPVNASSATAKPTDKTTSQARQTGGMRWADVGLLGMAAVGGIFCWRTRRAN